MGSGGRFGGGFGRQNKTSEKSDEIADTTADIQMPGDMEMPENFDPAQFAGMEMPEGFDPSQMQGRQPPEEFGGSENSDETKENSEEVSKSLGDAKDRFQRSAKISSGNFPSMSSNAQNNNMTAYIMLGISCVVLLCGIIFATKFKR